MDILLIILCILLLLALLYLLAIRGRSGHKGLKDLRGWSYAHRGLHSEGIPENSMAAFRAALDGGYGIELDVHLLKDGNLAVMHDSDLKRTTGCSGKIEDLMAAELENYRLEGTDETIPLFRQVLELYSGKAPLVVELKVSGNNYAALTETTCRMLEDYPGVYCLESFDPRCLLWLKKNRPELIRGQLSENYFATKNKLPFILKLILSKNLGNFLIKPDFIAYRYRDRRSTLSNRLCMRHMTGVSWTVTTPEEYDTAVKEGWLPIFEGFRPNPARRNDN
ncbi:MAG: glycerophosphodiester phosphodiesterase [Oscillospiraceae bacterium]|nr:glycerophosphodiester phosphodiesterase [Oscillospiraceae bacterium]